MPRTPALASVAFALAAGWPSGSPAAQPAPSGDRFTGVLTAIWGDPPPDAPAGGGMAFALNYPDGTRVAVDFGPGLATEAARLNGKRVVIRGAAAGSAKGPRIKALGVEAVKSRTNR